MNIYVNLHKTYIINEMGDLVLSIDSANISGWHNILNLIITAAVLKKVLFVLILTLFIILIRQWLHFIITKKKITHKYVLWFHTKLEKVTAAYPTPTFWIKKLSLILFGTEGIPMSISILLKNLSRLAETIPIFSFSMKTIWNGNISVKPKITISTGEAGEIQSAGIGVDIGSNASQPPQNDNTQSNLVHFPRNDEVTDILPVIPRTPLTTYPIQTIAAIINSGSTIHGQPYFSREITQRLLSFCNENNRVWFRGLRIYRQPQLDLQKLREITISLAEIIKYKHMFEPHFYTPSNSIFLENGVILTNPLIPNMSRRQQLAFELVYGEDSVCKKALNLTGKQWNNGENSTSTSSDYFLQLTASSAVCTSALNIIQKTYKDIIITTAPSPSESDAEVLQEINKIAKDEIFKKEFGNESKTFHPDNKKSMDTHSVKSKIDSIRDAFFPCVLGISQIPNRAPDFVLSWSDYWLYSVYSVLSVAIIGSISLMFILVLIYLVSSLCIKKKSVLHFLKYSFIFIGIVWAGLIAAIFLIILGNLHEMYIHDVICSRRNKVLYYEALISLGNLTGINLAQYHQHLNAAKQLFLLLPDSSVVIDKVISKEHLKNLADIFHESGIMLFYNNIPIENKEGWRDAKMLFSQIDTGISQPSYINFIARDWFMIEQSVHVHFRWFFLLIKNLIYLIKLLGVDTVWVYLKFI